MCVIALFRHATTSTRIYAAILVEMNMKDEMTYVRIRVRMGSAKDCKYGTGSAPAAPGGAAHICSLFKNM